MTLGDAGGPGENTVFYEGFETRDAETPYFTRVAEGAAGGGKGRQRTATSHCHRQGWETSHFTGLGHQGAPEQRILRGFGYPGAPEHRILRGSDYPGAPEQCILRGLGHPGAPEQRVL